MEIRRSMEEDFHKIMEIYEYARGFMAEHGNPNQWGPTNWPPEELIHSDIANGNSYVCIYEGKIVGTFFFTQGIEPTYNIIEDGEWLDNSPYGVIHRLAGDGTVKGIGSFCIEWAFKQCGHLRMDTHGDNRVMQNLLKKSGFVHCGTIYVEEDCYPRLAYERTSGNVPKWLKDAVFYEIYPQSFKDSNGDGIGDFNGIIEKLDYIKSLGCNAIWMNPCFDSPFKDAGYDVRDYKKTASRYGSNEDLIRLFEEVHKRDMHILLDLVPGHTSEEHEWFKQSSKLEKNEYSERYIWTDDWFHAPQGLNYVAGESPRNGVYVLNFFKCQPALNYGFLNPTESWQKGINDPACVATREAIKDIMRFWLDAGCDGFRVDMADSLVKKDDEKKSGTSLVWKDIRKMLDESYPEAALVSEWNMPQFAIPAGFHMDFCLDWEGSGYNLLLRNLKNGRNNSFFSKDSDRSIRDFLDEYMEKYEQIKDLGSYSLITGNHDTTRVSYFLNERELKLAYAFLFTMPGNPFIYYGDEIGMRYLSLPSKEGGYTRTGSRTPMQWDETENHGFSKAAAGDLYLPVDDAGDAPTVAAQEKDPDSMLNTVKALLAIRNEYDALKENDNLEIVYAKRDKRAFAYRRGNLLMLCNPAGEEAVISRDDIGEIIKVPDKKLHEIGRVNYQNNEYVLGGQSFGIFVLKRALI